MRIVYIAKHDSGGNDDEGAICYALRSLGHEVSPLREEVGKRANRLQGDFLLFHKWDDVDTLKKVTIPKVFWYFDLVDYPRDPTLAGRCRTRNDWMARILPYVDLAFLTDGDYVEVINNYYKDKAHWLMQGADTRFTGPGVPDDSNCPTCKHKTDPIPVLFTGISRGGGQQRMSFVEEMTARYKDKFRHVPGRIHGGELANLIASSKIVVCPDSPVTDRYWSNRVYLMCGFQAFVLHPYNPGIASHYLANTEIMYYHTRDDLYPRIDIYMNTSWQREQVAIAGYKRTMAEHTYTHRCAELIRIVKERLKI